MIRMTNPYRFAPRAASPRLQRGQALAEMAILAAVLVPMFLLIPILGKYAHTNQTTQQAARAAAWEATVAHDYEWNSLNDAAWREKQRKLVLDRHFGDALDPIRSEPLDAAADAKVGNVMMNTFSDQALVQRNNVSLSPFKNEDAGLISSVLDNVGGFLESLPGDFPPNKNGLVTAELVVNPENLKTKEGDAVTYLRPFDNINLEFRSQHVLLADAWGAAGSGLTSTRKRSVHNQVKTLVPASYFGDLSGVMEDLDFLESVPLVGVPTRLRPGYIQPDIVPKDRLQPYQP
jgi:hypothetical protein